MAVRGPKWWKEDSRAVLTCLYNQVFKFAGLDMPREWHNRGGQLKVDLFKQLVTINGKQKNADCLMLHSAEHKWGWQAQLEALGFHLWESDWTTNAGHLRDSVTTARDEVRFLLGNGFLASPTPEELRVKAVELLALADKQVAVAIARGLQVDLVTGWGQFFNDAQMLLFPLHEYAKAHKWPYLRAKMIPWMMLDEAAEATVRFCGPTSGEVDWRPPETVPEDYSAMAPGGNSPHWWR